MKTDNDYYDDLETREPQVREKALFAALPGQIAHAKANAPYFARLLKDVEPNEVRDRKALAKLPVTRKSDLIALQKEAPPFAGMTAVATGALGRVFSSPGPIYDPQGARGDFWRMGRALMARPGMILLDEPSMGLAPQIVEEIFEIVRGLNEKEKVSFLLAEQNTNVALRHADYGYILENGRVVMDGPASDLASNEDVKEFYLGLSTSGRKSFRDSKHYRRRKRWLA